METITLTRLYEVLAKKVGRNEAECLTQYVEVKIKHEVDNKADILASKKDLFSLKENLKADIHGLRDELKDDINLLRSETKAEIQILRSETQAAIHGLRDEIKEDIHLLRSETKADIHLVRNEMKDSTIAMQRWFLTTFVTLVIMILGLYAAIFLK